jgi:4-hydroxy-4-methyl-2-oxoglutarate aldolase
MTDLAGIGNGSADKRREEARQWRSHSAILGSALVADALDGFGLRQQVPRLPIAMQTGQPLLIGVCRTTLWLDFVHDDPDTYELELAAVDDLQDGEVMVAAAGGSTRSGIWGELLTTAAMRRGGVGVVTDGTVRDIAKVRDLKFPVYASGASPYDSFNRQKVVARDVAVEIGGVRVETGDLVVADEDGVVFVPASLAADTLEAAITKSRAENAFRDAVRAGMPALQAYRTFHVL